MSFIIQVVVVVIFFKLIVIYVSYSWNYVTQPLCIHTKII